MRLASLAVLALAAAAPAVAQTQPPAAPEAAAEAPAAAPAPADPALVVATVNGETITLGDLIALRADLPAQYQSIPETVLYDGLIEQLSNQILLRQAAERTGLAERKVAQRALAFQRTSLLAEFYVRERLNERITPETVEAEYQARYVNAAPVKQWKTRHILVPDEAEAKEIAGLARAEGADFAELAKARSKDPAAAIGGDLGWFEEGMMVPEFQQAALALEPGEVSDPVQTRFGWHVIKLEEIRDRPAPPLTEVREELIGAMSREITEAVVAALREAGEVKVTEGQPGIESLRDDSLIAE